MAKEVDTKVIEMQFDNADFEKGVKETRQSINGLKESISNLSDSANGTESIEKVNRVVVDKMNVLATAVDQTVRRITDGVINSVNKITGKFNELTLAPVSQGFSKYEEQVASVQTIMNATGKSIEDVQKQLNKLMWYTDETSYSYSAMASNIGKFTSAGVDLDDAVTAMMGIANWAGISGANANEASRAMYNLSQAIGMGSLKLQDWKSIENANMATKEFKETLILTGKEMGVLSQDTEITAENLRESLKDGWVTSDVLTATLKKYGNYTEELYKIQKTSKGRVDSATDAMEAYNKLYEGVGDKLYDTYKKFGKYSEEFKAKVKENNISMETATDLMSIAAIKEFNDSLEGTRETLKKTAEEYGRESEEFRKEAEKTGFSVKEASKMIDEGIESFKKVDQSLGERALKAAQEAKTFTDAWSATIDGVSTAWLRFWQAVWGNYEQAKEFWTWVANEPLYETFTATAQQIATVMEKASYLGARENIVEGFQIAWEHVKNTLEAVAEVFGKIFPFLADLDNATIFIYGVTERFKMWAQSLAFTDEHIKKASEGMLHWKLRVDRFKESVSNALIIFKSLAIIAGNIVWNIGRIITELLPRKGAITEFLSSLLGDISQVDKAVNGIVNHITFATNVIIAVIRILKNVIVITITSIVPAVLSALAGLIVAIVNFFRSDFFKVIIEIASTVGKVVFGVAESIIGSMSFLFNAIINLVSAVISVLLQFKEAENKLQWIKDWFVKIFEFLEPVRIIFDSVIKTFTVIIRVCGHVVNAIAEFVSNIDIWRAALILLVIQMVNSGLGIGWLLGQILGGFGRVFKVLTTAVNPLKIIVSGFLDGISESVQRLFSVIDVAKLEAMAHLIKAYAVSILILSGAAIILSTIDPSVFKQAMFGVLGLLGIIFAFMVACNKILTFTTIKSFKDLLGPDGRITETIETVTTTLSMSSQLLSIAAVIGSLALLMTVLGNVYNAVGSTTAFFTVISGVAVLLTGIFLALLIFTKSMAKANEHTDNTVSIKLNSVSGSITHLAVGLMAIAAALTIMNFIDPDQMEKSATILGISAGVIEVLVVVNSQVAKSLAKFDKDNDTNTMRYMEDFTDAMGGIAKAARNMALGLLLIGKIPEERLWDSLKAMMGLTMVMVMIMTVFTILIERINESYTKSTAGAMNGFRTNFGWAFNSNVSKQGIGGNDMLKTAFAIRILCNSLMSIALAVVPLSFFDFGSVVTATGSLIMLMSVVSGILIAFSEALINQNGTNYILTTNGVLKLAASIAITAFAIDMLSAAIMPLAAMIMASRILMGENDISPVGRAVAAIVEIIGALILYNTDLILALTLYDKATGAGLNEKLVASIGKSLVSMAFAVDMIATAIAGLAILRWVTATELTPAVGAVSIVIGVMAAFIDAVLAGITLVARYSNLNPEGIIKRVGHMVAIMALAVDLIAVAIGSLAMINAIPGTDLKTASVSINALVAIMGAMLTAMLAAISAHQYNTSEMITASGAVFLMMAAALDVMAVGIAGIMAVIGGFGIDTNAVISVFRGIELIFLEMTVYMGYMAEKANTYVTMAANLYAIALSTDLVAAAVAVIALSLSVLLSYGEDTYAGIGIFATLIALIAVYNVFMVEVSRSMPTGGATTLMAIAADFLMMSVAIAILAPAVLALTKLQKELGGATMSAAVLQGIVEPMIALIVGIGAIMAIANFVGNGNSANGILGISAMLLSLSTGMVMISYAAKVLSEIDTKTLRNVVDVITSLMWTFVGAMAVMAVISNIAGEHIFTLSLGFMAFAATLVIVVWALNSVRKALKEIAEDETIQSIFEEFSNWVREEPVQAAMTGAGVILGSTLLIGFIDGIRNGITGGFRVSIQDLTKMLIKAFFVGMPEEIGYSINAWTSALASAGLQSKFTDFFLGGAVANADGTMTLTNGLAFGLGKGATLTPLLTGLTTLLSTVALIAAAYLWGDFIEQMRTYIATGDPELFTGLEAFGYDMGRRMREALKDGWDADDGWWAWLYQPMAWLGDAIVANEGYELGHLNVNISDIDFSTVGLNAEDTMSVEEMNKLKELLAERLTQYYAKNGTLPVNAAELGNIFGFVGSYNVNDLMNQNKTAGQIYSIMYESVRKHIAGMTKVEDVEQTLSAKEAEASEKRIKADSITIKRLLTNIRQKDGKLLSYAELEDELIARRTKLESANVDEVKEAYDIAYKSLSGYYAQQEKNNRQYLNYTEFEFNQQAKGLVRQQQITEARQAMSEQNIAALREEYAYNEEMMSRLALAQDEQAAKEYKRYSNRNELILKQIQNESILGDYTLNNALQKAALDEAEKTRREGMDAARVANTVTLKDLHDHLHRTEEGTYGALLRQNEEASKQSGLIDDVEDASQGVLSVEEAVSSQYAEQNRLLDKQINLQNGLHNISKGNYSAIANSLDGIVTKENVLNTISSFITTWKNAKTNQLVNRFGGGNSSFFSSASQALSLITGGQSFDKIKGQLSSLLGVESQGTLLNLFNEMGGGSLNFSKLSSFDINNIEGSLKEVFGVDKAGGASIFNDIFGITGDDFDMGVFMNQILDDDQWNKLKVKLSGYNEDIDFTKQTDWSNVYDAADLAGGGFANAYGQGITDNLDYNSLLNPNSALNASETQQAIDAFAEAGDLAADAFRSSIEAQEDELKKTAEAMGESFALAFNAAEEATANPPLEKQNAEAINSTVENFEEAKMYANAYKRQLDTDKAALDKAKAKLTQAEKDAEKKKNADGSADVTSQKNLEKAKKEYEEAEARYNATKSKYDSYVEQAKGFKEDYLTAQEKKEFQKNPESLEEAIENKNREYELLQEALRTGDYSKLPDYIKSVDDLIAAMKATEDELATLTGYQEEIAAQNKDEEISGDIAPKYTEFDKTRVNASRKALREENEKLAQEYKENESLIAYYEKQNDDYSKKELKRLKERNKAIEDKKESNRNLYNSSSAKGYKELVGNREQTQYEINAIEEALKNYKSTGKIILPKSVMEKYSGTKNWGELLQTLYADLAMYDNDIRAVANIGLENAEDRPEQPDYISLAEQVGNLTSNFEDLFLASEMFTQALNEARTAVGDRLAELDREYTLNMGILKGLEGRTDEASVKRRNELEARQKEIDKERADISKNYNMLSAEDLKQKRAESEKLDKQISGYEALLRMSDTEFAKKSGGRDRSQIVDLYDKARVDKAVVDKELGVLSNVMTKGVESGESIETQTANLDINTQALALNVGGVDLSNAGDILSNVPITQADQEKWLSESSGYTPVNTGDLSKQVEDASKQATDNINAQLADYSSTLAMSSRNIAQQANKEVEDVKQSNDILGGLITSTNEKLDNLMTKVNNIYTNGVNYLAAITEIQNGMEDIANSGVYLDSKTLIGRIAPGLDRQLGGFAFRRA